MKYKLVKLVNGDLYISEDIILTDEKSTVIIDETEIDKIPSFELYKCKNPFCRMVKVEEEVKEIKTLNKVK